MKEIIKGAQPSIRVAIAGVGNCASALVQGIAYYRSIELEAQAGLISRVIGSYLASDIKIVAAFDVDKRKVGVPLEKAVFAAPNCTPIFFQNLPSSGVIVKMGPLCDGISAIMDNYPEERAFRVAKFSAVNIAEELKKAAVDILMCYLPVGAEQDAKSYATACLEAGVCFINCMPTFIASDLEWGKRFQQQGVPIIGDDIKSQVGATIVHQTLTRLMQERGYTITRTYQLNTGGNTDFLNMLDRNRTQSKIKSKTNAVQSEMTRPLKDSAIQIGPSDYVPWLDDNKIAYIRIEGEGFGGAPIEMDIKLSVLDSPNSAAVAIDVIRLAKLAVDRGLTGPVEDVCAYYMKSPPVHYHNNQARIKVEKFMQDKKV